MRTPYPRSRKSAFACGVIFILLSQTFELPATPTNSTAVAKNEGLTVQPPFVGSAIPQSTFVQPKKPAEGRDPFFPKSIRVYGVDPTPTVKTNPTPTAELALKGISGTPEQPLAIINTTTFSRGEENDVMTRAGKIRIRCVEINMSAGTVLIQMGGQSRELRLAPSK